MVANAFEFFNHQLLISLADETKYKKFKKRVTQGFATSEEAKLRSLFKGQSLGEQKPSQFLISLRNNASGQCNDTVLKSLFLEHLPDSIRTILAVSDSKDLDNLALLADKIYDYYYAVKMADNGNKQLAELNKTVAQLTEQVKKLSFIVQNQNRHLLTSTANA